MKFSLSCGCVCIEGTKKYKNLIQYIPIDACSIHRQWSDADPIVLGKDEFVEVVK